MLTLPPGLRIYLATARVDGRKGIDGLANMVRSHFGRDPLQGDGARLMPVDQLAERGVDRGEPLLHRLLGRGLDDAAVQRHHAVVDRADHAEAGVGRTRVDPDHDHPHPFWAWGRMPSRSTLKA